MMRLDLVPGVVPAAARGRRGTCPSTTAWLPSSARRSRRCSRRSASTGRSRVALIPGMRRREVAVAALGTVYAIEGGKEAARADRTGPGHQMESGDPRCRCSPGTYLRAAMRFHARRDPPRDRKLEMDGGHLRLYAALAYAASLATYNIRRFARRRIARAFVRGSTNAGQSAAATATASPSFTEWQAAAVSTKGGRVSLYA